MFTSFRECVDPRLFKRHPPQFKQFPPFHDPLYVDLVPWVHPLLNFTKQLLLTLHVLAFCSLEVQRAETFIEGRKHTPRHYHVLYLHIGEQCRQCPTGERKQGVYVVPVLPVILLLEYVVGHGSFFLLKFFKALCNEPHVVVLKEEDYTQHRCGTTYENTDQICFIG